MTWLYNRNSMRDRRKRLRNNSTEEEIILWSFLKKFLPKARFRRQYSVGCFIIDFYSPKHRLAIEVDGGYHDNQKEYDREREIFITSQNIRMIRFKNEEVRENLAMVMEVIRKSLEEG